LGTSIERKTGLQYRQNRGYILGTAIKGALTLQTVRSAQIRYRHRQEGLSSVQARRRRGFRVSVKEGLEVGFTVPQKLVRKGNNLVCIPNTSQKGEVNAQRVRRVYSTVREEYPGQCTDWKVH
jgi:hypothetical protein